MAFTFQVALSFAGENRPFAEGVASGLREADIRVFFDDFYVEDLWGEDLAVKLGEIYHDASEFCIMILSQHYLDKMWPSYERQKAVERMIGPERGNLPHPCPRFAEEPDDDAVGEGFLFGIKFKGMTEAFGYVLLVKPTVELFPLVLFSFPTGDAVGHSDLVPGPTAEDFEHGQIELDGGARERFGDQVIHEELGVLDQGFHV